MILVTGCNQSYFNRMMPYLDSLRAYADFPVYLVGVGFQPPKIDGVCEISITQEQNAGAPYQTESIQHGSFAQVIRHKNDEVFMYTDGDFIMQRPFDDNEREFLNLKCGQAIVQWNGGPHETLATEARRLSQKVPVWDMAAHWVSGWEDMPIYNVGLLAMTRRTWQQLHSLYMTHWYSACECFAHQARQQWLISYLLSACGFDVRVAPWHFHAHGHFGLKPGMERRADGIYADGKKALFRHYL